MPPSWRPGVTEVTGDFTHTLPSVRKNRSINCVSYQLKGVGAYTLYFYQPLTAVQCSRSRQHMEPIPTGREQPEARPIHSDPNTAD